jgi:hypothetical protein
MVHSCILQINQQGVISDKSITEPEVHCKIFLLFFGNSHILVCMLIIYLNQSEESPDIQQPGGCVVQGLTQYGTNIATVHHQCHLFNCVVTLQGQPYFSSTSLNTVCSQITGKYNICPQLCCNASLMSAGCQAKHQGYPGDWIRVNTVQKFPLAAKLGLSLHKMCFQTAHLLLCTTVQLLIMHITRKDQMDIPALYFDWSTNESKQKGVDTLE